MTYKRQHLRELFALLLLGTALTFVNQLGIMFGEVVAIKKLAKIDPAIWQADLSDLDAGEYYISAGKPTGLCDIFVDENLVMRGQSSERRVRDSLLLGTSFALGKQIDSKSYVSVRCSRIAGVPLKFPDPPIITRRSFGLLLHGWHFLINVVLGPGSSMLLLVLLVIQRANGVLALAKSQRKVGMLFGCTAFIYSLSLAYVTRFFLPIETAYTLHAVLRCCLSFILLRIAGMERLGKIPMDALFAASTLSLVVASLVDFPMVVQIYRVLYVTWSLSTVYFATLLWLKVSDQRLQKYQRAIVTLASVFYLFDLLSIFMEHINVQYPVLLALLCFLIGRQSRQESERSNLLHASAYRILRFVQSDRTLVEKFREAVDELEHHNPLLRLSAYIDSFCFGRSTQPRIKLERVVEYGYNKNTSQDTVVEVAHGRGLMMAKAMADGRPIFGVGSDGGQYGIIPVGNFACINLSDDHSRGNELGTEARQVLEFLEPAIRSLDSDFQRTAERSRLAINALQGIRGMGSFEEAVASVFLDVVGYSRLSKGQSDPFATFVKGVYFMSIEKRLADLVVREFSRGDELYLCAVNGFPAKQKRAVDAIAEALQRLALFVDTDGASLCSDYGFAPIRLTIGAAAGVAALVITESDVTTMGEVVNNAKRLQDAARPSEILVDMTVAEALKSLPVRLGPETSRLVKGDLIMSRSAWFPKAS